MNNRRDNLRICTTGQNLRNQRMSRHNQTGYKEVFRCKNTRRFRARIRTAANNPKHLGYFMSAELAAHAYNQAAVKYHGEFARLNELPLAA